MTIQDIIDYSTGKYTPRFTFWLKFICNVEATVDRHGNILKEDDHDGAGITFCGLTKKDDHLPDNPTPQWIADTYHDYYWSESRADLLPQGVGEEIANIADAHKDGNLVLLTMRPEHCKWLKLGVGNGC